MTLSPSSKRAPRELELRSRCGFSRPLPVLACSSDRPTPQLIGRVRFSSTLCKVQSEDLTRIKHIVWFCCGSNFDFQLCIQAAQWRDRVSFNNLLRIEVFCSYSQPAPPPAPFNFPPRKRHRWPVKIALHRLQIGFVSHFLFAFYIWKMFCILSQNLNIGMLWFYWISFIRFPSGDLIFSLIGLEMRALSMHRSLSYNVNTHLHYCYVLIGNHILSSWETIKILLLTETACTSYTTEIQVDPLVVTRVWTMRVRVRLVSGR